MDLARKFGIMVFLAVPGIVGGGILYAIYHSYTPVSIYAGIVLLIAGALFSR